MGNCLNTAAKRGHRGMLLPEEEESLSEMRRISQLLREEEEEMVAVAPAEGLKVKVVLTRGELEWLVAQLKGGERRLEDAIHHMQAANHAKGVGDGGWRPCLESILECPETQS
ncbi:hypothetical protein Zm00014a_024054 [Zea mays]|jgi:hypothetical protein|uniref:Uncharacterized protein n=2 Tax=Zea mays TaxID=4577 RepID=A0A1D6LTE5_MAIZE|nr:uncharacterized protein LOC100277977 [Zea mays]AQK82687.1 hypothetical protein ZEAMMB73_Zm00001d037033 [Zea mays]PWZ16385.1 hypothetical protein Zm00014a_024054 [Zea mays]|eukprot:NP_001144878.2 uncharacterized protein LOC100277977 [Zea mays]